FFNGYRPQFYFRTTDVTGVCELPEGTEMVMPGDNVQVKVELIMPIAMDEGLRFAIREGGGSVGAGVLTKIFEGCTRSDEREDPHQAPRLRPSAARSVGAGDRRDDPT